MKNAQIANLVYKQFFMSILHMEMKFIIISLKPHQTSSNLHIRQPHNENGKIMLKYQGPQIFNKLSKSIVNSHSFHTFKKKVKTH